MSHNIQLSQYNTDESGYSSGSAGYIDPLDPVFDRNAAARLAAQRKYVSGDFDSGYGVAPRPVLAPIRLTHGPPTGKGHLPSSMAYSNTCDVYKAYALSTDCVPVMDRSNQVQVESDEQPDVPRSIRSLFI
jgi:hypothetical protein